MTRITGRKLGSRNRGYNVFQRAGKSTWAVAWTDGLGKRIERGGFKSKSIATEVGKAKAAESDRVRGGVVSAHEAAALAAGKLAIEKHLEAWKSAMKHRGCTENHYIWEHRRGEKLCELAGFRTLDSIAPERVQRALSRVADDTSPQNARHYYGAFHAFIRWCIETRKLTRDPALGAKIPKAAGKVFTRTVIPYDKLPDLIRAARERVTRAKHRRIDRAMYWAVMAYTGLRRREAASLTPDSFDLRDGFITVDAAYSKNRRRDSLPIPADVAVMLAAWLKDKPKRQRVFPFSPHWSCEELFRADCAAAGITPSHGERLGVHSLRRFYITHCVKTSGLAVAQRLARHSTPTLTMSYTDLSMPDYGKAIDSLPKVEQEGKGRKLA